MIVTGIVFGGERKGGGISMHVWRRVFCQSWNSRVYLVLGLRLGKVFIGRMEWNGVIDGGVRLEMD